MSTTIQTTQWFLDLANEMSSPMRDIVGKTQLAARSIGVLGSSANQASKSLLSIDVYPLHRSIDELTYSFSNLSASGAEFAKRLTLVTQTLDTHHGTLSQLGSDASLLAKEDAGENTNKGKASGLQKLKAWQASTAEISKFAKGLSNLDLNVKDGKRNWDEYYKGLELTNTMLTSVSANIDSIGASFAPVIKVVADATTGLKTMIDLRTDMLDLFNIMKEVPMVGKYATMASSIVKQAFAKIGLAARTLGIAIMNIPIVGWIAAAVAGLIALGTYLWNTSETFRGVLFGIWEVCELMFGGIGDTISAIWNEMIKPVFNAWIDGWQFLISTLWQGITWIWETMKNVGTWLFDNLLAPIKTVFTEVYDFVMGIFDSIWRGMQKIVEPIKGLWNKITGAYQKGHQKGIADFYEDNPDKRPTDNGEPSPAGMLMPTPPSTSVSPELSPAILMSGGSRASAGSNRLLGEGSQASGDVGIKNITQTIDIKNFFNVSSTSSQADIESIAEKVVRAISGKLSDATIAIG